MKREQPTRVEVVNVDLTFWRMVSLMVRYALAAVPAMILLALIGAVIGATFVGFFRGAL